MNRLAVGCLAIMAAILVGNVLFLGRSFFLPIVTAATIAFIIISIADWFIGFQLFSYKMPRWLGILLAIFFVSIGLHLMIAMIGTNIVSVLNEAPIYQEKMVLKLTRINLSLKEIFGIDFPEKLATLPDRINLVSVMRYLVGSTAEIASSAGLIFIYLIFMLVEYGHLDEKIRALFPERGVRNSAHGLLGTLSLRMKKYVRIKTLLSCLTALCSYLVLIVVGVDFASFWALLIFLLNFIPNIGSIIATVFPCLLVFVQFDTWTPLFVVAVSLAVIQILIGSVLEPRLMSRSFNLSSFIVVLSLVIWGSLWGIVGMFLSVPLTVMATIILAHFKNTRWIAIMLSEDGQIKEPQS